MAEVQLIMPKMGESIFEATILTWLKKPGDTIEQDESVLEVATDKVDTEVPTTHAGVLKEILAKEGEVVKVGSAIAIIVTTADGDDTDNDFDTVNELIASPAKAFDSAIVGASVNGASHVSDYKSSTRFYSPLV